MPDLMPGNEEAARIYSLVRHQAIYSQGVPIDLQYAAVKFLFELYEVPQNIRRRVFERVVKTWHEINALDRLTANSRG